MFITELEYENLDGEKVKKVFHFHLSQSEVLEIVVVEDFAGDFEQQLSSLQGNPRRTFAFFRDLMMRSVGARVGDQFIKTPETQGAFMNTGAYDAMFEKLGSDAKFAAEFVSGVVPKSLGAKAMANEKFRAGFGLDATPVDRHEVRQMHEVAIMQPLQANGPVVPLDGEPSQAEVDAYFASIEAKPKGPNDYTREEILAMSNDEFKTVFGDNPRTWSKDIRLLAFRRAHNK
jgi:hypothetical protein